MPPWFSGRNGALKDCLSEAGLFLSLGTVDGLLARHGSDTYTPEGHRGKHDGKTEECPSEPRASETDINESSLAFVERHYSDGSTDWLWIKRGSIRSTDVDCTGNSDDEFAARIQEAREEGRRIS
jgi:hypothetical protein